MRIRNSNKFRYLVIMAVGVLMNEFFFSVAMKLNLPVWLDVSGTAFAALALEPAAGLIVGLINNFISSIFVFDNSSMVYYAVSASVAVIVGLVMKVDGKVKIRRIVPTLVLVMTVSAILSTLLSIWRNGGIPTGEWESFYASFALGWGAPQGLACLFGTFVIKVYDTIATGVLVCAAYLLIPQRVKKAQGEYMARQLLEQKERWDEIDEKREQENS